MARLPQPGNDNGTWGDILNDYLSQSHNGDGTLKDNIVTNAALAPDAVTASEIQDGTITEAQLDAGALAKLNAAGAGVVADGSITNVKIATTAAIDQSKINNLTTDLASKAASSHTHSSSQISDTTATGRSLMTAVDAASARSTIGAGTSNLTIGTTNTTAKAGDYAPTKSDVGLSNVDNTSDPSKPISTAAQTALDNKANLAHTHVSTSISDSSSVGRSVLTAADATAARAAIGAADTTSVIAPKEFDYIVSVAGSTYTATARAGSSLTTYSGTNFTTVLQSAIDALTVNAPNAGNVGSGGGKIHITKGYYFFGNAVNIVGWEGIAFTNGIPHSQLIIEGEGYDTVLLANTGGQHGFVVTNLCSLVLRDMRGYVGSSAKSWLFSDNTGAQSEMSIWGGMLTNLFIESNSTTNAPIHLRNFFDIQGDRITVTSSASDGFVLENASSTTHYGNSHWNNIRSGAASGNAFKFFSSIQPYTMNLMSFSHLETISGNVAVYTYGVQALQFNFCDFEDMNTVFFFDGNTAAYPATAYSREIVVNAGYLSCHANGTFFKMRGSAGAMRIWAHTNSGGDSTVKYIDDTTTFQPTNDIRIKTDTDTYTTGQISVAESNLHMIELRGYGAPLWTNLGALHNLAAKTTPVGADEVAIVDSADSYKGKRLTLSNLASLVGRQPTRILDVGGYYPDSTFPAVNSDTTDVVKAVNIYKSITDMSYALTGTPSFGDQIIYELTDNSAGVWTIAWGTKFEESPGLKLPVLLPASTKITLVFRWNAETSKWRIHSISGYNKTAQGQILDPNGNVMLDFSTVASAVNYITIGNDSGSNPTINARGGGTNVNVNIIPKGTGRINQNGVNIPTISSLDTLTNKTLTSPTLTTPRIANAGYIADANGNEQLRFNTTTSAVNDISITNAATGNSPTLTSSGDDTDINLNLNAKGAGVVTSNGQRVSTISRSNMSTAVTMGSVQSHQYIYFLLGGALPTLPTAVGQTATRYTLKNTTGSAINVATTSSQTIDGAAAPYSLAAGAKITLISDNAGWQSI